MRTQKRYSNVGFTKRVDHDGGRHRTARAGREPAWCPDCNAIYVNRRWSQRQRSPAIDFAVAEAKRCPACKRVSAHLPRGYLYLEGTFLEGRRGEIRALLENEAGRAGEDNPLGRVMDWSEDEGRLTLTTTTEHLAQRLGHALEKAYGGIVTYRFAHEDKLVRVHWRRD
jgi:hypothetical protein